MKKVTSYEYRSNNSQQFTVAHLECGHERVFEYGYYPATALCWEKSCEDQPTPSQRQLDNESSLLVAWRIGESLVPVSLLRCLPMTIVT